MVSLSKNWFIEHLVDFEYKKYVLLAYLQQVSTHFKDQKLYPDLAELVAHYHNLVEFSRNSTDIRSNLHGELKELDWGKLQLVYERAMQNDKLMQEIEQIVDYSIPQIQTHLHQGKDLYDDIEQGMVIAPIGIVPLYKNEGYLLLKTNAVSETHVYQYQMSIFESASEKYRGIHTHYVSTYRNSLINTFEGIKKILVNEHRQLPNPATYLVETENTYPLNETLLPIASRLLVRYIYS